MSNNVLLKLLLFHSYKISCIYFFCLNVHAAKAFRNLCKVYETGLSNVQLLNLIPKYGVVVKALTPTAVFVLFFFFVRSCLFKLYSIGIE